MYKYYIYIYISATAPLASEAYGSNCWSWIPDFLLDLHPPAGHSSGNPASSVRESDRFNRELTETQFLHWSRYPGNPENANTVTRKPLFSSQM